VSTHVGGWLGAGKKALIGVVHLRPLPGAPREAGPLEETIEGGVRDARSWEEGGADAVLVENYGDAPFFKDSVPVETVASLAAAAREIGGAVSLPLGVNVLRNDGDAALGVAVASGARFIRVNVLSHAYLTDQGIIEGKAAALLRKRKALGGGISILGDLLVKHASPLASFDPVEAAREMGERGGADGVILTGRATGSPADPDLVRRVAEGSPRTDLFIGSGTTPENVPVFLPYVRGFLAATWCETERGIDRSRVEALRAAIDGKKG